MEWKLVREDNGSTAVKNGEVESEFAALTWARHWLQNNADHDRYRLQPEADDRSMLMIRTVTGQWYGMVTPAESGAT
ncbi:hypothetical protein WG901_23135 [Novosphingobium sp. PS1R-30]|uniref:Uncharacterized protein n=1 Tax=Novosphingobium anseongense TaxID=3133436 RepID=A0ABU8S2M8_9SPHN